MTLIKHVVGSLALGLALQAQGQAPAQTDPMDTTPSHRQIFMMGLYPPDVLMRHQQRLGITDEQRSAISGAIKQFQSEVAELQWSLQNEQQKLRQDLSGYEIETESALAQAARVLEMESEFKLAHFRLLFAIKNELTDEQIDRINERLRQRRQQGNP